MIRVLLINMPFAAIDSPSLALGLFKSRLRQDGIHCDVEHLNFSFAETVGYEDYELILRLSAILAGEQLFARSVFGEWLPPDSEYYREIAQTNSASQDVPARLERIRSRVPDFLQSCLDTVPWHHYDLIGFTSLFEQNLPSLALARMVKQRYPEKFIVFGGANCEEIMGLTLHHCFPFVDFVCSGEADETFPELVKRLNYHHSVRGLPGLIHRENGETVYAGPAKLMTDLDGTPIPDYDDYFDRLLKSPLRQWISPSVLMESARGCWWGEKFQCTFCGLNGLTMGFRTKTVERTINEITSLMERYRPRIIRFVDNILSPNYFRDLLPEIAERGLKTDYICEVKANLKKHQCKALADAGVTVQAGIENLSTHVLDLMAKGSNSLMNVQTLKWCKQYGVLSDWNLLYGFPGEQPEDYLTNLELAKMITHLHPPSGCGPIRLDRFSPNFDFADEKGLTNIRPFKFYKYIYPFDRPTVSDLVYYFDFDYKEKIDNGGFLAPLKEAIRQWKSQVDYLYAERTNDGLIIHDSRPVASWPEIVLRALPARVYEYCDKAQTVPRIVEVMKESVGAEVSENEVTEILEEFVRAKLMVKEGTRYLSLAVLTYTTDFEQQQSEPATLRPELVQLHSAASAA